MASRVKVVGRLVPRRLYELLVRFSRRPPVGRVNFGDLRRVSPISKAWGADRGLPIDRFYIEKFLTRCSADIRGKTLETGTNEYTRRFGGERVTKSDVLHVSEDKSPVTIVADLCTAEGLESEAFDCVILTQTLHFIYDVRSALRTVHRILVPGGVLLATFPGISKIGRYEMDRWGQHWSFTTASARRLLGEVFAEPDIEVEAYGNVLSTISFLHGLGANELREEELQYVDPDYELLVSVRALKRETSA